MIVRKEGIRDICHGKVGVELVEVRGCEALVVVEHSYVCDHVGQSVKKEYQLFAIRPNSKWAMFLSLSP